MNNFDEKVSCLDSFISWIAHTNSYIAGAMLSNALVNAGLITFQKIEDTNPREIELAS